MRKMKCTLVRILSALAFLVGGLLLVHASPGLITQGKAEKRAVSDFGKYKSIFVEIIDRMPEPTGLLEYLLHADSVQEIAVPESLSFIGIGSAYAADRAIYFEYSDSIFGLTPFGILYTEDASLLDEWYKVEEIEGNWYYYRLVS